MSSAARDSCHRAGYGRVGERPGESPRVDFFESSKTITVRIQRVELLECEIELSEVASPSSSGEKMGCAVSQAKMLTARAITSASRANPVTDCTAMSAFALIVSGMTSVGLNAIMLVSAK